MGRFLAGFGPGSVRAPLASESCKQQLSALAPGLLLSLGGLQGAAEVARIGCVPRRPRKSALGPGSTPQCSPPHRTYIPCELEMRQHHPFGKGWGMGGGDGRWGWGVGRGKKLMVLFCSQVKQLMKQMRKVQ